MHELAGVPILNNALRNVPLHFVYKYMLNSSHSSNDAQTTQWPDTTHVLPLHTICYPWRTMDPCVQHHQQRWLLKVLQNHRITSIRYKTMNWFLNMIIQKMFYGLVHKVFRRKKCFILLQCLAWDKSEYFASKDSCVEFFSLNLFSTSWLCNILVIKCSVLIGKNPSDNIISQICPFKLEYLRWPYSSSHEDCQFVSSGTPIYPWPLVHLFRSAQSSTNFCHSNLEGLNMSSVNNHVPIINLMEKVFNK